MITTEFSFQLVSVAFLIIVLFVLAYRNIADTVHGLPKGPMGFPIVGHLPFLARNPLDMFAKWQKKYGDVYRIHLGSWDTVVLNGFSAISDAAHRKQDTFSSRPPFLTQRLFRNLNKGEDSLVFSPFNSSFAENHTLTSVALREFTRARSDSTQDIISEEANELATKMKNKCVQVNGPINVADDVQLAAGSIIYKLLYGQDKTPETEGDLQKIVRTATELVQVLGVGNATEAMPWLEYIMPWKVKRYADILRDFICIRDKQISDHQRTFDQNHIRDVTDKMIKINKERDLDENDCSKSRLLYTIQDLIGGGFETSTSLMIWSIMYITAYPEVQSKVQKEIDNIIGDGNLVRYRDRSRLPYTDATFHEILRISSVVPLAIPHYTTTDTTIGGYNIKKNTVVIFNLNSIAQDQEFWSDPQEFRPERFLNDRGLDRNKTSRVLSFGLGRRRCIAEEFARMEVFIVFATLVQRCSFIKANNSLDFTPVPYLVYRPKPFSVLVRERC